MGFRRVSGCFLQVFLGFRRVSCGFPQGFRTFCEGFPEFVRVSVVFAWVSAGFPAAQVLRRFFNLRKDSETSSQQELENSYHGDCAVLRQI